MAAIAQTIAIVDQSGKIISTSKQLKNVFKEAKLAYMERKAEIIAGRKAKEERELRKAMRSLAVDDSRSNSSKRRNRGHHHDNRVEDAERRSSMPERHNISRHEHPRHGPESISSQHRDSRFGDRPSPLQRFNDELYGGSRSVTASNSPPRGPQDLVRRRTDLDVIPKPPARSPFARSHSDAHIDMDLAYGEFHPDSLRLSTRSDPNFQKQELSSLVTKCKMLLEEANCAQHSVKAIISHLQKNPDAMAAVALTLAEISNLASKMAPGALTLIKSSAPSVFAMLAAPEFLIAVGVGVGLTVVMFGGYKIIKKIKARAEAEREPSMDEMLNIDELSRIEQWRRGIADEEAASITTSVEGEFITPMAAASMGHLPSTRHHTAEEVGSKHRKRADISTRSDSASKASRRKRSSKSTTVGNDKALVRVKKPSALRKIFSSRVSSN